MAKTPEIKVDDDAAGKAAADAKAKSKEGRGEKCTKQKRPSEAPPVTGAEPNLKTKGHVYDHLIDELVLIDTRCVGIWVGRFKGYKLIPAPEKPNPLHPYSQLPKHTLTLEKGARRIWSLGKNTLQDLLRYGPISAADTAKNPKRQETAKVLAPTEGDQVLEHGNLSTPKFYRMYVLDDELYEAFMAAAVYEHDTN